MAQVDAYKCDKCGTLMLENERTVHTDRYEGEVVQGELVEDLCPKCVQAPPKLQPIKQRKSRAKTATEAPPPTSAT